MQTKKAVVLLIVGIVWALVSFGATKGVLMDHTVYDWQAQLVICTLVMGSILSLYVTSISRPKPATMQARGHRHQMLG